jgi:hypothetical protein
MKERMEIPFISIQMSPILTVMALLSAATIVFSQCKVLVRIQMPASGLDPDLVQIRQT